MPPLFWVGSRITAFELEASELFQRKTTADIRRKKMKGNEWERRR